jgi:hypothetical protein
MKALDSALYQQALLKVYIKKKKIALELSPSIPVANQPKNQFNPFKVTICIYNHIKSS